MERTKRRGKKDYVGRAAAELFSGWGGKKVEREKLSSFPSYNIMPTSAKESKKNKKWGNLFPRTKLSSYFIGFESMRVEKRDREREGHRNMAELCSGQN